MKTKRSRAKDGAAVVRYPSKQWADIIKSLQTSIDNAGYARIVKTEDNREFSSTSEAWRKYCEACFVLSLPDKSDKRKQGWKAISKREQLATVRQYRGDVAHDELRAEMIRIYEYRKRADRVSDPKKT